MAANSSTDGREKGIYLAETLFSASEPHIYTLYRKFEDLVKSAGLVEVIPRRTRIVFREKVQFAAAYPRKRSLLCVFSFYERDDNPRFHKIEQTGDAKWRHSIRVTDEADFDAEFMSWIIKAYAYGRQIETR